MTPERSHIENQIREFDEDLGWYQNIDLGNGIHTKSRVIWGEDPDHPRARWESIKSAVPDDLSGMSVLDIGCNAGFLALEAKKRGADYVCGVDIREGYVEQARFCADVMDLDVDFQTRSVYDLASLDRKFDFIFFVGLLYHCKYLLKAVDQVVGVSTGTLIVESAIDPVESDIPYVRYTGLSRWGGRAATGQRQLPGTWHPNMTAMGDIFQEAGFNRVERLFKTGGRGGVVAYR